MLDRLTSGPAGRYTYEDTNHKHAATQVGSASTWKAQYDASGNMTCRATGGTTCGSTAATLRYDSEGRPTAWQNAQSSPTSAGSFLNDGEGNRVEQQSVVSGATTTTVYVGGVEEVKTVGGVTTYLINALAGERIRTV